MNKLECALGYHDFSINFWFQHKSPCFQRKQAICDHLWVCSHCFCAAMTSFELLRLHESLSSEIIDASYNNTSLCTKVFITGIRHCKHTKHFPAYLKIHMGLELHRGEGLDIIFVKEIPGYSLTRFKNMWRRSEKRKLKGVK
jgi:hypothetical protein